MSEPEEIAALRDAAEARLNATPVKGPAPVPAYAEGSGADLRRLVHELQVHQIELELQNET
ncbi:MAG: hypothetical protein K9J74_05985, partial [Sulfuritalea sp.]|nr:hypothetical protein [Sulfuritalea sp.]